MGFGYEFPHATMFDSDLREIVELYLTVKDLPKTWETYKQMIDTDYAELKAFVNGYFDNLDVRNEINKKLDSMVKDGTMSNIIRPIFNEYNQELNLLKARMDSFTKLEDSSTTGDAEIVDARIDKAGITHENVGEHIRTVTGQLSGEIAEKVNAEELLYGKKYLTDNDFNIGYIAISSGEITTSIRGIFNTGFIEADSYVDVKDREKIAVAIYSYDKESETFKSGKEQIDLPFTITSTESKFKVLFYWKETGLYGNISEDKANELKYYAIVRTSESSNFLGNNKNISNINERLLTVEGLTVEDLNSKVADYYFDNDYLPNKVKEINDNMCEVGVNGESFVFITDVHWDLGNAKQSPLLINYIKEHTNLDCIICGGDIINEGSEEDMRTVFLDFINEMKKIGIPFPIAYGNHDDNSNAGNPESEWFDNNTIMTLEFKHVLSHITFINPAYDRSFFFDKAETKTRFIFLDTRNTGAIKWESITPFSNALKGVPADYKVVVVAHWLIGSDALTGWGKRITDTLDAYNNRATYTNDQNNVTYDFAECNGKCVLIICGHTHKDIQMVTDGGIPLLNTTCDNYNRADESTERTKVTITEQAFDVVTVDYVNDSVKVVRIGGGNNRSFANGDWS